MNTGVYTKTALLSILLTCLMFGATPVHGGWELTVSFTTTSPGGNPTFDPSHVHAVWIEDASGALVKTSARWGIIEHEHLAQWRAVDGFTGATPQAYQSHSTTWDLTDRDSREVPDGP